MTRRARMREWLQRYGPPEVLSLLATVAAAAMARRAGCGAVATALAAVWAGNLAYFGLILARDVESTRRLLHEEGRRYGLGVLWRNVVALAVEFGAAEALDSLLIRPALMVWVPRWLGSLFWGIVVAKFAADVTFYVPAILSYELGARRLHSTWIQGASPKPGSGEGTK